MGEQVRKTPDTMEEEFHLGRLIRKILDDKGLKVTWLAKEINVDRSVCYDIFKSRIVRIDYLERISKALNYNFFNDLAKYEGSVVKIPTQV